MFERTDAEGNQRTCSVVEYYKEQYPNFPITRPDLPCVLVGPSKDPAKTRIPMEMLSLMSFQAATVTPELQADMIKETAAEPLPRFSMCGHCFAVACILLLRARRP